MSVFMYVCFVAFVTSSITARCVLPHLYPFLLHADDYGSLCVVCVRMHVCVLCVCMHVCCVCVYVCVCVCACVSLKFN
jgi:hypothetical protein